MTIQTLPLALLKKDPRVQQRASLNQAVVDLYREAMQAGDKFPAMLAFKDGADYWLVSGFHRAAAYEALGVDVVDVDVAPGTMREAILHAVGDNAAHGLQRTADDKKRAVMTLLEDPEWSKWSMQEIARRCCVSPSTVAKYRSSLSSLESDGTATYVTKHGTVATMNTGNIGRQAEPAHAPPPAAAERHAPDYEASAPAAPAPAPSPAAAPPDEPELGGPSEEELASTMAEHNDKLAALEAIVDADDKLAAAVAKIAQQAERIRILEERVRGLTNEAAQATRLAKSWRLKFERSGKA